MAENDMDDDMQDLFGSPAYKEYDRLLHGQYIAALMERVTTNMHKDGIIGGSIVDGTASTLSDELKRAFQESQAELAWTPLSEEEQVLEEQPQPPKKKKTKKGGVKKKLQDDFGDVGDDFGETKEDDFGETKEDDFGETKEDDFGETKEDDFIKVKEDDFIKVKEDDFGGSEIADDDKVIID